MRNSFPLSLAALALALATSGSIVSAATPPAGASPAKPKAAPAAPPENAVSYGDLRQHIGESVIVHTTFKTTRSGVLTAFSNTELTLRVETPSGPTEFTIPKNTVSSAALVATPAPDTGKPSAQKN